MVQFFKISAKFGQWYTTGIELSTNKYRVFRCDRITSIVEANAQIRSSIDELLSRSMEMYQSKNSIHFEVEISEQAEDLFYKEHYPSMHLETGDKTVIKGFYNPEEEAFIADYFIRFGKDVISVKPDTLKQALQDRVEKLLLKIIQITVL